MPSRLVPAVIALSAIGGSALILLLTRLATGPILALLRGVQGADAIGATAFWLASATVMLGGPLAGWWADQAGRRVGLLTGVLLVAASLVLMTFLHDRAWVALYVLMAFGVALVGVTATASLALGVRRVLLATAVAFCLPFARLSPAVPPGGRALVDMGERAFATIGLGYLLVAVLPLVAIGLGYLIETRRTAVDVSAGDASGAGDPPAAPRATLDPMVATAVIVLTGWLTQVGPAATDLVRSLEQDAVRPAISLAALLLAGLASYVWAIAADVTTPGMAKPDSGIGAPRWLAACLVVFAAGTVLALLSRGTSGFGAGMFLASAGASGIVPIAVAAHLRVTPASGWSYALGFAIGAFVFGQLAGARLNVYLASWFGTRATIALSALAAAAAMVWLLRKKGDEAVRP